jgi:hypothetical protein
MQWLFNTFNHNELGKRSLEDILGIMCHQLRAMGHEAVWDPKNTQFLARGHGINFIVEGFTDRVDGGSIKVMADAHAQGAEFVIVATEEPTEKGFNFGSQKEMINRQEVFHKAAQYAIGILHLVPGEHVTRWYSQFCPSAYAELGYAPSLMRPQYERPQFDFGFYGSVTPRRMKFLKKLARRVGNVKLMGDFKDQTERDRQMQKAKVLIQVRKFESMGLVSSSRCNTALSIGRPVIGEPHLLAEPWGSIARFSQKPIVFTRPESGGIDELKAYEADFEVAFDEFTRLAQFARGAWKELWNDQMAKFKRLTPEVCIGEPLRRIGVLDGEGKRAAQHETSAMVLG